MTSPLNERQQLACNIQQSQSQACYSLGVDGRQWDVSNLRSRRLTSSSTSCRQLEGLFKGYPLYPSRYLVKDIPDVHLNSIFDVGCQAQQAGSSEQQSSTYHEGLLRRFSENKKPNRKLDFRDDFTRISQKPLTRTINEEASRQEEKRRVSTAGEKQVAREELKKPPPPAPQMEIEVSPGYYLRIRGAAETNRAIQQGRVRPTVCSCCTTQLYCIMVAEYVICPTCREMSPVDFKHNNGLGEVGGVGLGLTPESLQHEMR